MLPLMHSRGGHAVETIGGGEGIGDEFDVVGGLGQYIDEVVPWTGEGVVGVFERVCAIGNGAETDDCWREDGNRFDFQEAGGIVWIDAGHEFLEVPEPIAVGIQSGVGTII